MSRKGRSDYGDYDREYEVCDCGNLYLGENNAKMCKSCARKLMHRGREAAYQQRKLTNHRIYQFWHNIPQPDPVEQIGREIARSTLAACLCEINS